jgi:hypothetical protein
MDSLTGEIACTIHSISQKRPSYCRSFRRFLSIAEGSYEAERVWHPTATISEFIGSTAEKPLNTAAIASESGNRVSN